MGLFLQTVILPRTHQGEAAAAMEKIAEENPDFELDPKECQYLQREGGAQILCECIGYDSLAEALSLKIPQPVLLLYIYDEDFWGYYLYENGKELDQFCPMPDYFEEVSQEERSQQAGDSAILSRYFGVTPESVQKYLCFWTEEMLEGEGKAYPEDEASQCDCWQMADFMNKLGFPYEFD